MVKRKVFVQVTAIIMGLMVLFLSGCSGKAGGTPTDAGNQGKQEQPIELLISTAPSLKGSLEEIKGLYEGKNPQVKLVYNYGPSGSLQNQIEQGAAADIFISQGKPQMDALEAKGLIKQGSRVNLLGDELVLVVNKNNTGINSFEDLAKDEVKKIGIGEAQSVPAAKTAKETLDYLKLWDKLAPKFVVGKDLMQIMTYVETDNVEAGLVWDTIAITSDKVRIAAIAPAGSHNPVVLPAAIINSSKNSTQAAGFLEYLQSDEAMKIFTKNGFIRGK